MSMPRLTAHQSIGPTTRSYYPSAAQSIDDAKGSVEIAIDLNCILKCGIDALNCLHCGSDTGCWANCAGPDSLTCVLNCL
jgi:hypothetical protein